MRRALLIWVLLAAAPRVALAEGDAKREMTAALDEQADLFPAPPSLPRAAAARAAQILQSVAFGKQGQAARGLGKAVSQAVRDAAASAGDAARGAAVSAAAHAAHAAADAAASEKAAKAAKDRASHGHHTSETGRP